MEDANASMNLTCQEDSTTSKEIANTLSSLKENIICMSNQCLQIQQEIGNVLTSLTTIQTTIERESKMETIMEMEEKNHKKADDTNGSIDETKNG